MKRYVLRCFSFVLLVIAVNVIPITLSCIAPFNVVIEYLTNSQDFYDPWEGATMDAMNSVQTNAAARKAVLGDSVKNQMFRGLQEENPDWCICEGGNSAFLLAGQYAMMCEFLHAHPQAEQVYLVLRPLSFGEYLNGRYSYQFVIRPLAMKEEYRSYLTEETLERARSIFGPAALTDWFGSLFDKSKVVRKFYLNTVNEANYHAYDTVSDESFQYLQLMFSECEARGVQLVILACPMADTPGNRQAEQNVRNALQENGLLEKMPYYFPSLLYYPADAFYDGVHFADPEPYRSQVLKHYQEVTGMLDDLLFENREG